MEISELQKEYEKRNPDFQELNKIVSEKLFEIVDNPVHSIKFRVKDFNSFYEKISRKGYEKPFSQCTDLIGCRVVLLFKNQTENLIQKIEKEFNLIEKVIKSKKVNEFSYGSIHLVCKLKKQKRNLDYSFEIQIRTILQEAWAEIEHYLNYKQIGIDKEQQRKINALSALMEIADDQFQQIYDLYYTQNTTPAKTSNLTPELLYFYCKKVFPWAWENKELFKVESIEEYNKLLNLCEKKGIKTINDLDNIYKKNKKDLNEYDKKHVQDILNNPTQWPSLHKKVKLSGHFFAPTILLSVMIRELYKD